MVTQGDRQNFQWRPNTNDSTTLARYDQEAKHWLRALNNSKPKTTDVGNVFGVIGLVLQLVINLVWLLFYGLGSFFTWLFGSKSGGKFEMKTTPYVMPKASKLDDRYDNADTIDIYG